MGGPRGRAASSGHHEPGFPWAMRRLLGKQNVVFGSLDELPAEAARDRDSFQRLGAKSNLVIPLVAGGRVLGALAFVTVTAERTWSDELVHRLRLIAEVFANALARKEAEDALRTSELMKSAILASLTSSVTVLDRQVGSSPSMKAGRGSRASTACHRTVWVSTTARSCGKPSARTRPIRPRPWPASRRCSTGYNPNLRRNTPVGWQTASAGLRCPWSRWAGLETGR